MPKYRAALIVCVEFDAASEDKAANRGAKAIKDLESYLPPAIRKHATIRTQVHRIAEKTEDQIAKKLKPTVKGTVTLGEFTLDEVFSRKPGGKQHFQTPDGKVHLVKVRRTMTTFFKQSHVCACCGLVGDRFLLQQSNGGLYLHLYGPNDRGELVMLTRDHIVPTSKGGLNEPSNYQPLCRRCNQKKGNDLINIDELRQRIGIAPEPSRDRMGHHTGT